MYNLQMKYTLALFLAITFIAPTLAAEPTTVAATAAAARPSAESPSSSTPSPPTPSLATKAPAIDSSKTLYALGALMGRSVQTFNLTPAELAQVQRGLADSVLGKKLLVDAQALAPQVQQLQSARMQMLAVKAESAGAAFADNAAKQPGATRTASGIVMTTLTAGQGASPTALDQVKVHYEGRLIDGTVFDSSRRSNQPAVFPLKGVIPCWTEAVQLMKVGGKARVICPAKLAYGERGSPPLIRPGSTLVFEVELIDIVK